MSLRCHSANDWTCRGYPFRNAEQPLTFQKLRSGFRAPARSFLSEAPKYLAVRRVTWQPIWQPICRPPPARATARPAPAPVPSPRQVKWWLLSAPDNLTEEQRTYVRRLAAAVPLIATAQQLAQAFGRLVRKRDHAAQSGWLQQAAESGVAELRAVGAQPGMRRDQAAIAAALVLPWSQGQTEGQVTRLKLLKRAMYGRGGLDLLRGRLRRSA